jgi:hypothetical protein
VVEPETALDQRYYERGIAARGQAHEGLDGLTDLFDKIDDRADAQLDELLTVLEGL